jgi:uncharacterized membrane protein
MSMLAFVLLCVFTVVVILALAFARLSVLSTRIGDLETRVRSAIGLIGALEKKIQEAETRQPVTPVAPLKTGRAPKKRPSTARTRISGEPSPAVPPSEPGADMPPAAPPAPVPPPHAKSRTKEEWEALIGGKLLNRIGALALILGVGFFLQYAFANDWITEPVRVLIGVLLGLGLLVIAARSASGGFQIFAQGLVGAGIAILYLSVYASFNYYHLVAQPWAFVFMSAVTVITFTQAFKYNSIVVALLGWLGGFLTPFLLSTGEVNPAGLFSYLALLDVGLLVIAWRMDSWMSIEPLSMAATYLIYALWLGGSYTGATFVPGFLFLVLFWVMFHGVHTARVLRNVTSYPRARLALASFHGIVVYVLLYTLVNNDHPEWRVPVTLALAILYGATSVAARRTTAEESVFLHSALTAIVLVICATWIQFKGMALVQYLSVEGLALTWAGSQWKLRSVRSAGLGLYVLTFFLLLGTPWALSSSTAEPFTLLFNSRAFTFLLLAACLALSAILTGRAEQAGPGRVTAVLHVAWCWILFLLITVETNDFFAQMIRNAGAAGEQHLIFLRVMTIPVVWGAYALLLVPGGRGKGNRPIALSGLIMLLLSGCVAIVRGLTFSPIEEFVPLLNRRMLLLIILVAEFVLARRIIAERREVADRSGKIGTAIQAGIVLLVLVLVTGETWDYFSRGIYRLALVAGSVNITEELSRLQNLRQLFLSAGWVVYSIVLMTIGIWKRARFIRMEAIILFGVSILKIFIYDLSFLDTLYRIFSFVGLGVILLAVSYLYQRYGENILGSEDSGNPGSR